LAAVASVFQRFATESISFAALAHYLNKLGFRTSYGGLFQSDNIEKMLGDPTYLGYYCWNKKHTGRFHRFKNGQTVLDLNYEEKLTKNDKADWVHSRVRLFEPIIDQRTWDAVQRKLQERPKQGRAPRRPYLYLSGLVYCGNCCSAMVAGSLRRKKARPTDGHTEPRHEFFCSTYFKAIRQGLLKEGKFVDAQGQTHECKCLRNGICQDTLEGYIERYLEESGRRLELLCHGAHEDLFTGKVMPDGSVQIPGPLFEPLLSKNKQFVDRYDQLLNYIRDNDPAGWEELWRDVPEAQEPDVETVAEVYRSGYDPAKIEDRLAELEGQHDILTEQCLKLTTRRAIDKANKKLADLEAQIKGLEEQKENLADIVEKEWQEILDLSQAVSEAQRAMLSETGERALRQRAQALRAVIQRIECTFTVTGHTGGGPGKKNSRLAAVTIYPVAGDTAQYEVQAENALLHLPALAWP
jgi:hypothetical protein